MERQPDPRPRPVIGKPKLNGWAIKSYDSVAGADLIWQCCRFVETVNKSVEKKRPDVESFV
jgi:hypothetical protein